MSTTTSTTTKHAPVRPLETVIEQALQDACAVHNIMYLKFTSSVTGVPDRILQGINAAGQPLTVYVELKRPGTHPRTRQKEVMNRLINHGALVFVVDARDIDVTHFRHNYHTVESLLELTFLSTKIPVPERFDLFNSNTKANTYSAVPAL
ncbi:VRR-NUC domain-containing protein [Corynebacterium glutamicum]|uniref:VRR-NUC domain-containing protein n=1 Tax=Corynebacterium glutamicum (strain ATCC 13032 / DSM 20300 / JCM 1318 / BCRC 11384 / CCUG 27702 / LMG 3730 / NBRC 12168 / NCIMB 10025 / NRRL B-2784 / 534) TaxID=196627 RepID=Q8NPS0_CORGL|nr:VRR-NUC domain-containing protein [Corynebacterium glutamicum]ARV64147.1 VRR-NUC domain-containing protein [Corynebacterium glutamicum]AUI01228.1 VRR-NUC domain-containing protein [Corynebacterium glutamicum]AUI04877.1 VRR-NUC domain-containing protein [Corynebacterium glutamicum]MBA4570630.1 VRR-NUC domain-containing protein [Corynebacterium glutamicum]MBA4573487.1 VRR-NUC domain-containing protein [Corynebacterium glutamicum]